MAFPPKPAPLTTDPSGKPGIPDHLVENARRAIELARAHVERSSDRTSSVTDAYFPVDGGYLAR